MKNNMKNVRYSDFKGIQALRFFAALLVVIMHSTLYANERLSSAFKIWGQGSIGVDIFFIISGFVMVMSSQKLLDRADGWQIFIMRRICRIAPLYWGVSTIKLIILLVIPTMVLHADLKLTPIVLSFLFLPSFSPEGTIFPFYGVGWTLNFEMFFYVIFAGALFIRISPIIFSGILLLAFSWLEVVRQPDWPAVSFYFDSIILEFLVGMLLARAVQAGIVMESTVAALLLFVGLFLIIFQFDNLNHFPRILKYGIPALMVVTGIIFLESFIRDRVSNVLLFLGDSSFALYLIHPMLSPLPPVLLKRFGIESFALSISLSVLLAIVVSMFIWHFVDRPVTRKTKVFLKYSLNS